METLLNHSTTVWQNAKKTLKAFTRHVHSHDLEQLKCEHVQKWLDWSGFIWFPWISMPLRFVCLHRMTRRGTRARFPASKFRSAMKKRVRKTLGDPSTSLLIEGWALQNGTLWKSLTTLYYFHLDSTSISPLPSYWATWGGWWNQHGHLQRHELVQHDKQDWHTNLASSKVNSCGFHSDPSFLVFFKGGFSQWKGVHFLRPSRSGNMHMQVTSTHRVHQGYPPISVQ